MIDLRGSPSGQAAEARVIVTGASGFIGARTLGPLRQAGYEVHALARSPKQSPGCHSHRVDLFDLDGMSRLVESLEAEFLLHLAWTTHHGLFWHAPENLDWAAASLSLLRAFREAGGRRAVFAGTCAEYDWSETGERCRERNGDVNGTAEKPQTLYGAAKHGTHTIAAAYANQTGLSLAWGRIFFLYGPGEGPDRLVPSVARALLDGRAAKTTAGDQVRDFMHVDDAARAFVRLLTSGVEGSVNIASGEAVTLRRVIELVGSATGRPDLLRIGALAPRKGEPARLVADTRRLEQEVGFSPCIALEDGIEQAVAWWRAERPDSDLATATRSRDDAATRGD